MSDKAVTPKTEAKKEVKEAAKAAPAGGAVATAAAADEKEVCRAFRNTGKCRFEADCKYIHSEGEQIAPPPRDYTPTGECHNFRDNKECRFAERCRFVHGESDKRTTYRPERKEGTGTAAEESGERQICRNFQKRGKCRFADKCRHIHVATERKEKPKGEAAAKKAPKTESKKPAKKAEGKAAPAKSAGGAGAAAAGADGEKKKRRRPRKSRASAGDKLVLTEENKYDADRLELCRNFRNKGKCRFGEDCTFSHAPGGPIGQPAGERPPREPREPREPKGGAGAGAGAARVPGLCYNFRDEGECEFGAECRFKHGDTDSRDFSRRSAPRKTAGVCYQFQESGACEYADECRFSHSA